jgi:hypothetical protein
MHKNPALVHNGMMEQIVLGKATQAEIIWLAEWAFHVETAITIENETTKRGWRFCLVMVRQLGAPPDQNTWATGIPCRNVYK